MYHAYNGGPSGHRYMHFFGSRFLIVSPLFLAEPPRALYKFGRAVKRAAPKAQLKFFFPNFRAVADFLDHCRALLGQGSAIPEGY